MKYFSAIAVLALVSSQASALQLHDDIMLPEEEELFLQLAASAENQGENPQVLSEKKNDWGDLATHNWVPLAPKKAALDYTDPVREAHSSTVQGHLASQKFTKWHNSADELNDVVTAHSSENKKDAKP